MNKARNEWLKSALKIIDPIWNSLEKDELKEKLPLDFHKERAEFAPLEAFGRSVLGIAPWLELESIEDEEEKKLQKEYRVRFLKCLDNATNKEAKDFMVFNRGGQPLVDAAFLAEAIVRMKTFVNANISEGIKENLISALISSRKITAYNCNWIFFTAMVEAGLYVLGAEYDMTRVLYALRTFREWYKGDGMYGDGPMFHFDYYNSFVIQPMYVDLVRIFEKEHPEIAYMKEEVEKRASRYAGILERMIGPDGSYPVVGRSIAYRFGVFHELSQAALMHNLPKEIADTSVRCGLSAVISRVLSNDNTFDEKGFLKPGVCGYQPELAEEYINIGSLYLCSTVFLPLGLSEKDNFWCGEDSEWTGLAVWSGRKISIDHAID
ncbi:MAG: DUF2264 domain-containing protein [Butyrivibrio sp.]|nr:DUF2264 domain-containing protein [Butyrivibrio sp.]